MDLAFAYYDIAVGGDFIGRKKETDTFIKTIIDEQKGISLYGAPKSGKNSFIKNGLSRLKAKKYNFTLCEIDLSTVLSYQGFVQIFKRKMHTLAKDVNKNSILPFDIQTEGLDEAAILNLPEIIAEEGSTTVIIYIKEFQNVYVRENEDFCLEDIERIWSKHHHVRYILTGSFVNPMKYIFEERKLFYYMTHNITLSRISEKEFCNYVIQTFLDVGRVIEEEEAVTIYNITDGNLWYTKLICATCLSLPVGYINASVVTQAKEMLISTCSPRFTQTMADLTPNQINFLRAVLDHVPRFSSSEILEKYKLNSSANVFRLKEALKKKEVITFDSDDTAYILDPLFNY
ncbi:MAG: hypothetical protein WC166_04680, partial [Bacteroidales bacterium]